MSNSYTVTSCGVCGKDLPSPYVIHSAGFACECPAPPVAGVIARRVALFFCMQFLSYSLLIWNYRAAAKGWIGNTVLSDVFCGTVSFWIIGEVAEAKKDHWARFGYIAGGAAGSAFSIWLTRLIWGS